MNHRPTPTDVRRSRRRMATVFVLATAGLPLVLLAREGTVTTTDGRTLRGEITERGDEVRISRSGIDLVLPRNQVAGIEYGSVAERIEGQRAGLAEDDVAGRLGLAREAFDGRAYDVARELAQEARRIDPANAEAAELLAAIDSQQRLDAGGSERRPSPSAQAPPSPPRDEGGIGGVGEDRDPASAAPAAPPPRPPTVGELRGFLSPQQVNRIRQAESRPNEPNLRVRFVNNADRDYVENQPGLAYREFRQFPPAEQARRVLDAGGVGVRDSVQIQNDPLAIADYRRVVQPLVLQGCATSSCHGGGDAGGLVLFPGTTDAATYTNFHTLITYTQPPAEGADQPTGNIFAGPQESRLIDRGRSRESLLLTYALPAADTQRPHPTVRGYTGVFRGPTDPRYAPIAEWIDRTLKPVQEDYGFEYTPPAPGLGGGPPPIDPSRRPDATTDPNASTVPPDETIPDETIPDETIPDETAPEQGAE